MRYKPFGKTGMTVSQYGLGTWAMGGGHYGPPDDDESIRTIHLAQDLGANFLDTAPMYSIADGRDGRAEQIVGRALRGRRDKWLISTKFGRHLTSRDNWKDTLREDYSGKNAVESVEQSLQRLDTDYVDVLLVHSPPSDKWDPHDAFDGVTRLKEQGKVRAVGFSFWNSIADTIGQVEPFLRSGQVEVVEVIVNLLQFEAVNKLFPIIAESSTAVIAREVLAAGFLTDSFTADDTFGPDDYKSSCSREVLREGLESADRFRFLFEEREDLSGLPEAALNYAASFPEVSTLIPGAKTTQELRQCFSRIAAAPFDDEMLARIREVQSGIPRFRK